MVQILCLQSEVIDLARNIGRESAKGGRIKVSSGEQAKHDLCRICNLESETLLHVFGDCGQAMQIWRYFGQTDNDPLFPKVLFGGLV